MSAAVRLEPCSGWTVKGTEMSAGERQWAA